ncbi:hypothetical protein GIB67_023737 [Kingdonia uniflora]|uniref:Uncharacterized protein n=1 Tax=Kingdonia uniflora TaxID=39325 RepID=A0A7J7MGP1_9MAGN|nr:hypothetical protein GIB67_023737 [Kingdonia uniflora]
MLENFNIKKDGFRTSVGVEIDIDGLKISHHDVPTERKVPCASDFVGGIGEDMLEVKAGVVSEELKKFDGDGLEMKHYEATTEREVYRAIDLVGGTGVDVLESSRSKFHEEVVTLMREVRMINDFNCQEAQPKKANPNPKPLPRIWRTIGEGMITSPTTEGGSPLCAALNIDKKSVDRDLDVYRNLLSKLVQAKELLKEYVEREKKKREERTGSQKASEAVTKCLAEFQYVS